MVIYRAIQSHYGTGYERSRLFPGGESSLEFVGSVELLGLPPPGKGDWLPDDMRDLALAGGGELVSLLTDGENTELALTSEESAHAAVGVTFDRVPTPNRHVPERTATLALSAVLRWRPGEGSVWRSTAVTRSGGPLPWPPLCWSRRAPDLSRPGTGSRQPGVPVPDTAAQREFISTLRATRPAGVSARALTGQMRTLLPPERRRITMRWS